MVVPARTIHTMVQKCRLLTSKALDGQQWATSALPGIAITTPNGTHLGGQAKVDVSQFNAPHNTMNVTMGDN